MGVWHLKFYNDTKNEVIWDANLNKVLCAFKDGELETEDKYIIDNLKDRFKSDFKLEESIEDVIEVEKVVTPEIKKPVKGVKL
jgi:hypothetical protein